MAEVTRNTYLFVTRPDRGIDRVYRGMLWSCTKSAQPGERVLVYKTGGPGIVHEWRIASPAKPNRKWGYMCQVSPVARIDPSITIQALREAIPQSVWGAPYQNFRGMRAMVIPPAALKIIDSVRGSVAPPRVRRGNSNTSFTADQYREALSSIEGKITDNQKKC